MMVLIADDDRVLTHVLSIRLKNAGYQTLVAYDAMQAIMMAMKQAPDAIVLDVNMPAGTGLQVLRQLKNSARTSSIPIIVVSGSADPDIAETVLSLGADEFLTKPPNIPRLELIATVSVFRRCTIVCDRYVSLTANV
jgi:DNA-binding response OmpR family regulator